MPSSIPSRSRLAPTPSGFLHLGNAYNFLLTEKLVRRHSGELRLRIDDLDADRVRPEYILDIFETLHWLGIAVDQGPKGPEEVAAFSQQKRLNRYQKALDELVNSGKVFACDCSRTQIRQQSSDGQYPGTCRDKGIPLDKPDVAWRFRTEDSDVISWKDEIAGLAQLQLAHDVRDFMVRRRDGIPAYHIASLCDDVDFGINIIVRGQDLLSSTAAQLHLAEILGWTSFSECRFYHHPLIEDDNGEKLSKSAGSSSLKALRAAGIDSSTIREAAKNWYESFLPGLKHLDI